MDARTFDRLIATAAQRPTRRSTLRLLAGALLGALGVPRLTAAQPADSDNDGLLDDDEVNVYGTRPDIADTDGDGFGDGQEICNRDRVDPNCQQDQVHINPLLNEGAAPPPEPGGAGACVGVGGACSSNTCCQPDPDYTKVQCCFDANGAGVCTDVFASGLFRCPEVFPATGCPVGQTNCGGFCTDLSTDHGNCGTCGNRCSQIGEGYNCVSGTCTFYCLPGLVDCGGYCADVQTDFRSCGRCGNHCGVGDYGAGECVAGKCVYPVEF